MADDNAQEPNPAATPGETTEADGFGAAFAERAADPGRQASGTQADGDKPSDNEPAPAGSNEAPAAAAAEAGTSGTASADPWEGLNPEQKSYFERLQASERSQRGRVGALTKKLQMADRTRAPEPAPKEQPTEQGADTKDSTSEEASVSDLDKRLQATVDEYGDVVGPIAEILKDVRAEIASLKDTASKVEVEADAQELTKAYTELEKVHPDFAEIAEDTNFAAWVNDQPQQVVALANSFDPREVSLALTLFKTERSAAMASQTGQGGDQGDKGSTATDTKRQRQLEGSRSVPSRSQPSAAGVPNDFSSAFKARASAQR
jgi:hypothetical protein